jgi:reverse transcriptase-like protein
VGEEICAVVLNFLTGGSMPADLNHTFVVLTPKVRKPVDMKELRPISLCNVSYKLISKVLANRLKKILPMIIDEHQSAFVPGRLITDNILLSSEVFHFMKNNQANKRGYMALKLDMSKAYDRVEWDFLRSVMTKMGFPSQWIERVMLCVSSVSYSFLVNGQPTNAILPQRGLRQGDPLSPYLFLLCTEGFGGLIKQALAKGELQGLAITRKSPMVSHLFFADDSLIFTRANSNMAASIKSIIQRYEHMSGQKINFDKSEISFSHGLGRNIRDNIRNFLGMNEVKT